MLKRIACLLLALSLLSGPAALAADWSNPASERPDAPYEDMLPVEPFDETELQAALDELEDLCLRRGQDGRDARQRAGGLYRRVLSEIDKLITRTNLAGVQYDGAGGAGAEAALYLELSAQQTRLYDRCYQVLAEMAGSPYADILEDGAGEERTEGLRGYQGLTEEEAALYDEEDSLIQAYDQIISRDGPAAERNRDAGEIFLRLVRLRNQIAASAGYDNYAEYAYEALYTRDYGLREAKRLRKAAKKYILPLQLRLLWDISDQDLQNLGGMSRMNGEEVLDAIQPFIEEFDTEMGDTFSYMRRNHLYDIEYSGEKLPTGYTVALPEYGSAFIFNSPYGDYRDLSDTVHEFGHFHETFHNTEHDLWSDFNIDVGEIDSQALELMFTGHAGELFGEEYGRVYENAILYNILDAVLDGCLYDEFQTAAYTEPDLTADDLDRLFKELSEEYGYSYDGGVESDPSWVENGHTFRNPMYFISYATSALSALDLWFLYLDWPQEAKDIYLELSALSLSLPYRAAAEAAGLRDIFDSGTIPALAELLEDHLDGRSVRYDSGGGPSVILLIMVCIAAGFILFCVLMMVRRTRFLAKRSAWGTLSKPRKRQFQAEAEPKDPWNTKKTKPPWEF